MRIGLIIPSILGVLVITFILTYYVPGDPILALYGEHSDKIPEETRQKLMHELRLDLPLHEQFLLYVWDLLHGELGKSIYSKNLIINEILFYFPATFELATASILFAIILGVILGVVAATRMNKWPDHLSKIFSIFCGSMPSFFLGLILLIIFYYRLDFVSPGRIDAGLEPIRITGFFIIDSILTGNLPSLLSSLKHIILPSMTLGLLICGIITRMVRSTMIDILNKDFIVALRARGLSEKTVVYKHALKNSLIPTITIIGLSYGGVLSGSVIVERIFAWPGIGKYMNNAVFGYDFPVVMAVTIFLTMIVIIINLLVDLLYGFLDPRIRYG